MATQFLACGWLARTGRLICAAADRFEHRVHLLLQLPADALPRALELLSGRLPLGAQELHVLLCVVCAVVTLHTVSQPASQPTNRSSALHISPTVLLWRAAAPTDFLALRSASSCAVTAAFSLARRACVAAASAAPRRAATASGRSRAR